MKMIDVLDLMAEGKIEVGAKLKVIDIFEGEYEYEYIKDIRVFLDEEYDDFGKYFDINTSFLNLEVELIPPKPKEYQLKLYAEDDLSYVVRSSYNSDFNYDFGSKLELCEFTTRFTQDEIDNDKLLKFVEMHGIKEEVEE